MQADPLKALQVTPVHVSASGGPVRIVATDNGDGTDMTAVPLRDRKSFNGLALAIVRSELGKMGTITVKAHTEGVNDAVAKMR